MRHPCFFVVLIFFFTAAEWSYGYPRFENCDDLTDADFNVTTIVGFLHNDPDIWEPIEMVFDPVYDNTGKMHVNIYWIQRGHRTNPNHPGEIKFYDAQSGIVSLVGKLGEDFGTKVYLGDVTNENGLAGLVLDPGFKENRLLYVYYSTLDSQSVRIDQVPAVFVVERYKLTAGNKIDEASRKRLLTIPMYPQYGDPVGGAPCCHSGGSMAFDAYGDLWIGVGDQSDYRMSNEGDSYLGDFQSDTDKKRSAEWGTSNTHSLLGSVLRIHPDDTDSRGYTIPEGNFGDYFADIYPAKASDYLDTGKVLPELFAKGMRNPYTITLDPIRRWVTIGECGPDGPYRNVISPDGRSGPTEEHDLFTRPSFGGFPYFAGPNVWIDKQHDPLNPINDSPFNDGLRELPPADTALHNYKRQCAVTGPIYRYDPKLDSEFKMPPHFHRKWLITDHLGNWVKSLTVDEKGENLLGQEFVFPIMKTKMTRVLDFEVGPDGALYFNSYGHKHSTGPKTQILRLEYTGDCRPTEVPWKMDKIGCKDALYKEYDSSATHHSQEFCQTVSVSPAIWKIKQGLDIQGRKIKLSLQGPYEIRALDLRGEVKHITRGKGNGEYILPEILENGVYLLQVNTDGGSWHRKIILY